MRPALWQAVAAELRTTRPGCRLTAVDDFNARIKAGGSKAKLRAFYQPREGDVAGEARVSLILDGRTELGAIAHYSSEQEAYAKKFEHPLSFEHDLIPTTPEGAFGEATIFFRFDVMSWHGPEFIRSNSGFYAAAIRDLIAVHAELSLPRE